MLKRLAEEAVEELCTKIQKPTYLDLVMECNVSKEFWEKGKRNLLKEIEEVDKYFEEKEKEEKKPILTDEEREYLSVVIKPFRNNVRYIMKNGFSKEILVIQLNNDAVLLPSYEKGTTYKGMEKEKSYTLEELGL